MSKERNTLEDMRPDHRQWDYEHSIWRVDIERWRTEHESALSDLAKLQEIIREHGDLLDTHAETMEWQQQRLRDHNRAMAEFKRVGGGSVQEAMGMEHRKHAEQHNGQRAAHERIEEYHHKVVAHQTTLRAAIEAVL